MNVSEQYARKNFILNFRFKEEDIVNQVKIGDWDYMFEMADGRRIIYDELNESISRVITEPITHITKEDWKIEFSRKLKNKLNARCIPQKEFAHRIGVNAMTMSRYINGKHIPDGYIIREMERQLDLSPGYLTNFDYLL